MSASGGGGVEEKKLAQGKKARSSNLGEDWPTSYEGPQLPTQCDGEMEKGGGKAAREVTLRAGDGEQVDACKGGSCAAHCGGGRWSCLGLAHVT